MVEVLETVAGHGGELVLRQDGDAFEVIENGVFLMDTRGGESERLLVNGAADRLAPGARMLIGGLGVGFSLRAALDHPDVGEVVVVEREPAVIAWNRTGPLRTVHSDALADPRVTVVEADLVTWLRSTGEAFDALCLDIDNGPEWTVTEGNAELYAPTGLGRLVRLLRPGGVLAVWSAGAAPAFTERLRERFASVEVVPVPVPRGEPDVVWFAR
ncbi:spermine/spermidine synthase domain-containing protein [Amycolatopsis jiangsuensis]|uniref:Spermidine synthase n=1 Tax=Amycolatopsis jiangsuensis TaxID=1181879 RepID=A0A840IX65_9PSEU|nr:spermidine synthase [Amycolatopsis jiangsuensis]MBB4686313.1 spermidine synthase [Amycolatopsis jiangsuensis]